jgi:C4-dicarboxylate-specific signal transduction histidine kinase
MAKKVLSVVVAEQEQRIATLTEQNAKLKEQLANTASQKDSNYSELRRLQLVVDELHAMLDAAPNPPPRRTSSDPEQYRSSETLTLLARLLIWTFSVTNK